jgi:hypothetical protein
MNRIVIACAAAVALGAGVVLAASPQVDAAIKAIQAVGADAAKLKTFCELTSALEAAGEKEDPELQKKVDDLMAKLGPDFEAAWEVGDGLDENSADAKEFNAAVDALAEKCT